jgi:transcriptional regulator with XRE-family HTH domain
MPSDTAEPTPAASPLPETSAAEPMPPPPPTAGFMAAAASVTTQSAAQPLAPIAPPVSQPAPAEPAPAEPTPAHVTKPAAVPHAATGHALRWVEFGLLPHTGGLPLLNKLEPVSAGLAAGLVVTNRAPASVAVAIEFGRAGSGWASAVVFNLWLRRQLRARRMSQRQLALLSGVDHSTISRLLIQDRRPSLDTATKLAKALRQADGEFDTADFFDRTPEEALFPARRVEIALRSDELLDDASVVDLMKIYLQTRRKRQTTSTTTGPPSNHPEPAGSRRARS